MRREMVSSGGAVRRAEKRRDASYAARFAVYGFQTRFSKVKVNQRESLGLWLCFAASRIWWFCASECPITWNAFERSSHLSRGFSENRQMRVLLRYRRFPSLSISFSVHANLLVILYSFIEHYSLLVGYIRFDCILDLIESDTAVRQSRTWSKAKNNITFRDSFALCSLRQCNGDYIDRVIFVKEYSVTWDIPRFYPSFVFLFLSF